MYHVIQYAKYYRYLSYHCQELWWALSLSHSSGLQCWVGYHILISALISAVLQIVQNLCISEKKKYPEVNYLKGHIECCSVKVIGLRGGME